MREGITEPEYSYVKGQGWVARTVDSRSIENYGYRLTLYARKPDPGERWYLDSQKIGLERYIRVFEDYGEFSLKNAGVDYERFNDYNTELYDFYTVKIEKL